MAIFPGFAFRYPVAIVVDICTMRTQQVLLTQQRWSVSRTRLRCFASSGVTIRKARDADMVQIRERLLKEKMNPLRLDAANFTVVEGSSGEVIAFAQLEQVSAAAAAAGDQPIYEFRSLVVAPEHRGKGHGSALVQQMMADCPHDCYLTTVSRAIPFYENAGFRTLQLNELPQFLWFEFAAGSLVARLAVNDTLVAMARLRAG